MNRKTFLRNLGLLALAPLAIRQIAKEESHCMIGVRDGKDTVIYHNGERAISQLMTEEEKNKLNGYELDKRYFPLTYNDCHKLINWKISGENFYDKDGNLI